jgi:hypothetical protein
MAQARARVDRERHLGVDDPVLALIAEEKRLEALWIAADSKGHDRQAKVLDEAMGAILNQIRNTKPVTLAGAIAMLELGLAGGCVDEGLTNTAIAGLRDMRSEAARISPGDSKILALFREWVAARRHMSAVPDEEFEAACAVLRRIEDTINETPSSGAAGLAIKSYLALHAEGGNDPKDAAALGDAAINYYASILKDAISFVPELAPLARHAIEVAEQNAEAEPTIIGFGEPEEGGAA